MATVILEIIKISVMQSFRRWLILLLNKSDEHSPVGESITAEDLSYEVVKSETRVIRPN